MSEKLHSYRVVKTFTVEFPSVCAPSPNQAETSTDYRSDRTHGRCLKEETVEIKEIPYEDPHHTLPNPDWEPKVISREGYLCASGQHFWPGTGNGTKSIAEYCCGPWICPNCGQPRERYYTSCSVCRSKGENERWNKAEKVEDLKCMISANDRYFADLDDFLDHCFSEEIYPGDLHPYNTTFRLANAPDVAEYIMENSELEEPEHHYWMDRAQRYLEAMIKKTNYGGWFPNKTVPVLPTREEWEAELAKETVA